MPSWVRFSLGGPRGDALSADTIRYGPGLPDEQSLRFLGHLAGRRVLDLGCGSGSAAVAMAKSGAKVIAIDETPEALAAARAMATREQVRIETHNSPLAEMPFVGADSVDLALSVYALASVDDIDRVFRQVNRVLRPESPFVFSLPHPAFNMLDPSDQELQLRRPWWDPRPVAWSVGPDGAGPDRPHTFSGLVSSLTRASFRLDTVAEPAPDPAHAGDYWCGAMGWVPPTIIIRARKEGI
jgi:SAM-dependent methyltransferase